jgi:ankyrin repeat protein
MAVHGSRLDLLRLQAQNDPGLLSRSYSEAEIYPPDLGVELPPVYAYVTPLRGVSLLHMAVEWADLALARWLLDEGADVNAAARTDDDGWGGWTPLFHAMVSLRVPRSQTDLFSLLVERGAQTAVTASIRKPVRREGQIQYVEYRDVTPLAYARGFDETDLVNEAAVQALA